MNSLQKKAMKEAIDSLKSFDNTDIYRAVQDALHDENIDNRGVLDALSNATAKEKNKVRTAKSWLETLMEDEE